MGGRKKVETVCPRERNGERSCRRKGVKGPCPVIRKVKWRMGNGVRIRDSTK